MDIGMFESAVKVFAEDTAETRKARAYFAAHFFGKFWNDLPENKKNEFRCFPDSQEILEEDNTENNRSLAMDFILERALLKAPNVSDFEFLALDEYERPKMNFRNLWQVVDFVQRFTFDGTVILINHVKQIWRDEPQKITLLFHIAEQTARQYGQTKNIGEMLEIIRGKIEK